MRSTVRIVRRRTSGERLKFSSFRPMYAYHRASSSGVGATGWYVHSHASHRTRRSGPPRMSVLPGTSTTAPRTAAPHAGHARVFAPAGTVSSSPPPRRAVDFNCPSTIAVRSTAPPREHGARIALTIGGMRIGFVVPARGGSKGLVGKNLRTVAGTSVVGRAVAVANRALRRRGGLGTVIVDTDAEDIAAEGRRWGAAVPFLRPPELARDDTPTVVNVMHAVERLGKSTLDVVVLLQPTSPLRSVDDVLRCIDALGTR